MNNVQRINKSKIGNNTMENVFFMVFAGFVTNYSKHSLGSNFPLYSPICVINNTIVVIIILTNPATQHSEINTFQ